MLTLMALASAGGYADAASYMLAGKCTGHLTGNTVLLLVALGTGAWRKLLLPGMAVVLFLIATATGLLLRRPYARLISPLSIALPLEAILIPCAPIGQILHRGDARIMLVACLYLALGIQNGVFQTTDGVSVHATYITGDVTSLLKWGVKAKPANGFHNSCNEEQGNGGNAIKVLGYTWLSFGTGALVSACMVH